MDDPYFRISYYANFVDNNMLVFINIHAIHLIYIKIVSWNASNDLAIHEIYERAPAVDGHQKQKTKSQRLALYVNDVTLLQLQSFWREVRLIKKSQILKYKRNISFILHRVTFAAWDIIELTLSS